MHTGCSWSGRAIAALTTGAALRPVRVASAPNGVGICAGATLRALFMRGAVAGSIGMAVAAPAWVNR